MPVGRVAVVAACSCLLVGACASSATLRSTDIEQQIADALSTQVGGRFSVTCPTGIVAEAGASLTCSVLDDTGGTSVSVTVVTDDDQGHYTWRVDGVPSPTVSPS